MIAFEYKPALLAGGQIIEVFPTKLIIRRNGQDVEILYKDLKELRFWEMSSGRGMITRSLDLVMEDATKRISLSTGSAVGPEDHDYSTFMKATGAALSAIERHQPERVVSLSAGKGAGWTLFSIGVVALLFAAGLPIAAAMDGRNDRLLAVAIPMVLLGALGLALMSSRPWKKPETISARRLADVLAGFAKASPYSQ